LLNFRFIVSQTVDTRHFLGDVVLAVISARAPVVAARLESARLNLVRGRGVRKLVVVLTGARSIDWSKDR
jgi:hypothetical protein